MLLDPTRYPIQIRVTKGLLELSQPELGLLVAETPFSEIRQMDQIGRLVVDMIKRVTVKLTELKQDGKDVPAPRKLRQSQAQPIAQMISVSEASVLLGVCKQTVRMIIDKGELYAIKTPGGHNKLDYAEVVALRDKLHRPTKRDADKVRRRATYHVWYSMRDRCTNPNSQRYSYYGGRGIQVCERWLNSFDAFMEDMGLKPDGLSIDRINNDGNYEPANCRWATDLEQSRNQRKRRTRIESPTMESMVDLFVWGLSQNETETLNEYGISSKLELQPDF